LLRGLGNQRITPEEDRFMLEFVGFEAAKWCSKPDRRIADLLIADVVLDTAFDQGAQGAFEPLGEVFERAVGVISGKKHAAIGKMPLPKCVQRLELTEPASLRVEVERLNGRGADVAKGKDVGCAAFANPLQRFLEFPFGPGHRHPVVQAAVFANSGFLRERGPQPRPEDKNDNVKLAGRIDRVLERARCQHRLVLPAVTIKSVETAVVLRQLVNDKVGAQALVRHITRRGNENPQALRHVRHSPVNLVTNMAHSLQPGGQPLEIAGVLATACGPGLAGKRPKDREARAMSADITSAPDAIATGKLPLLDQAYSTFTRRLFFGGLVGATCLMLAGWFASVISTGSFGLVEALLLALFVLNAPSLAIGFWNAALGFALRNGTRATSGTPAQTGFGGKDDPLTARTAVAMVIRNEPPAGAFVLLKTLVESLDRNGHLSSFDFFILSDSDQPDVVAAEEAAFVSWRAEAGSSAQVFYRRRTQRAGFKPGTSTTFAKAPDENMICLCCWTATAS
jgi:hypothetical protein